MTRTTLNGTSAWTTHAGFDTSTWAPSTKQDTSAVIALEVGFAALKTTSHPSRPSKGAAAAAAAAAAASRSGQPSQQQQSLWHPPQQETRQTQQAQPLPLQLQLPQQQIQPLSQTQMQVHTMQAHTQTQIQPQPQLATSAPSSFGAFMPKSQSQSIQIEATTQNAKSVSGWRALPPQPPQSRHSGPSSLSPRATSPPSLVSPLSISPQSPSSMPTGGFHNSKQLQRGQVKPASSSPSDSGAQFHKQLESQLAAQSLYKTELCRSFEETKSCRYGVKCQFAHGKDELRIVLRHPKYKTERCESFHTLGTCAYGTRCRFIHNEPITSVPLNAKRKPSEKGPSKRRTTPERRNISGNATPEEFELDEAGPHADRGDLFNQCQPSEAANQMIFRQQPALQIDLNDPAHPLSLPHSLSHSLSHSCSLSPVDQPSSPADRPLSPAEQVAFEGLFPERTPSLSQSPPTAAVAAVAVAVFETVDPASGSDVSFESSNDNGKDPTEDAPVRHGRIKSSSFVQPTLPTSLSKPRSASTSSDAHRLSVFKTFSSRRQPEHKISSAEYQQQQQQQQQ